MRMIARFSILFFLIGGVACDGDEAKTPVVKPVEKIPEFTSFSPSAGGKETVITMSGKNFGSVITAVSVKVNGLSAKVLTLTDDKITAEVPSKSGLGPLELTVSGKVFTSLEKFRYLYSATTSYFSGGEKGFANGPAKSVKFEGAYQIVRDALGTMYLTDLGNCMVRKVEKDGFVSTIVGTPHTGFADGKGDAALLHFPIGIDIVSDGTIYVADTYNNAIRKITADGNLTTITGSPDRQGHQDGDLGSASFNMPYGVKIDKDGVLWICDTANSLIRKIGKDGKVTTFAGSTEGYADGKLLDAKFHYPVNLAFDETGNIFVADKHNHCIRKISADGLVTTFAGKPGQPGFADGAANDAMFNQVSNVKIDKQGNLFVTDLYNHCIRLVYPDGVVTTLAGVPTQFGYMEGIGNQAKFYHPQGCVLDDDENVYVTDSFNSRIRKLTIE